MFTIAGSGFGLYGYLPALIESLGEPVLLPQSCRSRFDARPELQRFRSDIRWVADFGTAMEAATGIVIASTPGRQPEIASRCCRLPALTTLLLEKPVAITPALAMQVLDELKRSGKRFRIGYTFLHTAWGSRLDLRNSLGENGDIEIIWTFMAHHFSRGLANWKRDHSLGGGVIRFFGIHLLAMLAHQGYRSVGGSVVSGEDVAHPESWRADFSGPGLPACHVAVDSRADANVFRVAAKTPEGERRLVDLREPFEEEAAGESGADNRVGVLKRLLASFQTGDESHRRFYDDVNVLWQSVEDATSFERRGTGASAA